MTTTNLSMVDVVASIRKHRRLITFITIAAVVSGAFFYSFTQKKYTAKTEFLLRNPMYGDHTVLYNNANYDNKLNDYFANEEDLNKIILLAGTDIVQQRVINNMKLVEAFKVDTSDPKQELRLERMFDNSLKVIRTEYRDMILTYTDTDPKRAVAIANECVKVLDDTYSDYFREMRKGMYGSILYKIHDEDSAISALTDTLVAVRDRYGIYSSRYNFTLSSMKDNSDKKIGNGVEQIDNIELAKAELVTDRAQQRVLINHYKTGLADDQLPMIKVVTPAKIPKYPGLMDGLIIIFTCGALGFLFSTLALLFSDSYLVKK
jgi:capsular polysaccharide biosynthesis protein